MNQIPIPERERQALREVGHTDVKPATAWLLAAAFLAIVVAVPLEEAVRALWDRSTDAAAGSFAAFPELAAGGSAAVKARGFFAANHALLEGIQRFEDGLEERSLLRERLLPPVQAWTARWLGLGNEQAYLGRSEPRRAQPGEAAARAAGLRWLFYRADVDAVTGPAFLDPAVLARRALSGDAWRPAPAPDPRPPILALARDLEARGTALVVVPTPVKPTIHPEMLSGRYRAGGPPVQNLSFAALVRDLEAAGVTIFDPAPLLAELARREPAYLAADTHWTPAGIEEVAAALARRLEDLVSLPRSTAGYFRRRVAVDGLGDVAAMLRLPEGQDLVARQSVVAEVVLDAEGGPWRPDPAADVLLLGDSFSNVYSDPALGWGTGAGLAEQLSFHLQRSIDRIARNAGGAHATREALSRELAAGVDRLAGKRAVIYQFATRELALGDWRQVELARPPAESGPSPAAQAGPRPSPGGPR